MGISKYIEPISNARNLAVHLLEEEFGIHNDLATSIAESEILPHFDQLKNSCYLFAETPYVDRVYRNSYYHYFASKHKKYNRDCIRISIFDGIIEESDFTDVEKISDLKSRYRGFIVLRPTEPFVIGRNLIAAKALKNSSFLSCSVKIDTTVNGVKFLVEGFPHSSQDTETKTCAETTLWAIMEYFGNRYSDYQPVLPFKIVQVLKEITSERQMPSTGLTIQEMSFALRQFGFGSIIYSEESYGADFKKLFRAYIESGIPVICGIDNLHTENGDIGHAVICVGREHINDSDIDNLAPCDIIDLDLRSSISSRDYKIYDWGEIQKDMIFIDDNFPVYQRASLDTPTSHYSDTDWKSCTIKHFVVPLYPKIYLEAYLAKNFVFRFLIDGPYSLISGTEVLIRFFLCSSRSFKDSLSLNGTFQSDIKEIILELAMPKFIWIAELSNKALIKQHKADGIIILDATEANVNDYQPLIVAAYQNHYLKLTDNGYLEHITLSLNQPFKTYCKNFKNS